MWVASPLMRYFIFILSFIPSILFAQREGYNWYFGLNSGINFNSGFPIAVTNSAIFTWYGSASISDSKGNLLFYTDGMTVWNKNNTTMTNGTGLMGSNMSTQSALIVPLPGSVNIYYIFTVPANGNVNGFRYSIVDISLNSGLGAVTLKNIPLITPVCEKITAIKNADNKSIWIITHLYGSDAFCEYQLTSGGLNLNPIITHIGSYHNGTIGGAKGYMKVSPDSKTLAVASSDPYNPFTELFDFNNLSGLINNPRQLLYNSNPISSNGIEFSPDGSKLYTCNGFIYQFNIKLTNLNAINNSIKIIYDYSGFILFRALQVAPDGKIYLSHWSSGNPHYLASINNPNDTGILCNFIILSYYLGISSLCAYGLPTFMQSYFFMADFIANNQCLGDSTSFILTNKNQLDSVSWNFGDVSSGPKNHSKLFNPSHKFSDTGTFHVVLVFYHEGKSDTTFKNLKIYFNPYVSFNINDTSQCMNGNYFKLNNLSNIQSGTLTYRWDFGDSTFTYDTLQAYHSYKSCKTFTVKLVALSNEGCSDSFSKQVVVKPSPVSLFTVNDTTQCLKANKLIFTNQSSIVKNSALIYKWYFGNGDSSTIKNPVYSYKSANTFPIRLITTSNLGCKDTFSRTAIIYPQANPTFSINDSAQCLSGNSYLFNNLTTTLPTISSWLWKFGDGITDNSKSTSHIYKNAGTFNVNLISTTTDGCVDTTVKNVQVYKMPDTSVIINSNIQCLKKNLFTFSAKSGATNYSWDFGDGKTDTGKTVNHSYSSAGNYIVKLFQTSNFGCSDTVIKNIVVNPSPDATFSASDTFLCFKNNSFTFNCINPAITYLWNLGDGNTNINKSVVHSYLSTGNFKVMLVVANGFGCRDTTAKNIVVNPNPDGKFTVDDSIQCFKGNSFIFANSNQISIISRQWKFGDAKTDTGLIVTHTYPGSGNYTAKLIVTNTFNCIDSSQKNIIVRPSPASIMNINDTAQCLNQNSFILNCPSPATSYQWNFGDGNINSGKSVIHKYLKPDTFNLKLVVANVAGCKDSALKNVIVFPSPNASFTVNNTSQCLDGNSFSFVISNLLSVISNLWGFGDLNSSALQNPVYSYSNAGAYSVKLIVMTKDNCSDTAFKSVIVKPNPQLPNISSNSPLCENKILNLTANSDAGSAYQWKTDNGFTSTSQNPVISNVQLNDTGNYYVTAILNGCPSDTAYTYVQIYPSPYFDLGNSKTICDGDRIILDPGFFTSYLWQDSSTQRLFNVTAPGIYSVKVFNSFECSYEDSIEIIKKCPTRLYIPDAFSPNNDGHNDKFEIIAENIKEFDLIIFSRWGEKIFHSTDPQNSWDGTYKGSPCPVGVYYYQLYIRVNDGIEKNINGTVTLIK